MSRSFGSVPTLLGLVVASGLLACKNPPPPAPVVVEEASAPAPSAPKPVDLASCAGCALSPTPSWSFEGVYSDPACTSPLAQITITACAQVPAFGSASLTYVDEVGKRKANETVTATLAEAPASAQRYRLAGKVCVRANEAAVDVTPGACAAHKVCRDTNGALSCAEASCRTLANGCPDYEETRLYATIDDPGVKGATSGTGVSGNVARLLQCCNVLNSEATRLGLSPEAGLLRNAAAQCSALAKQVGPSGTAPEAGLIRGLLAGRNVPAACAGF
ncbi:MAG: hypothetical protein U0183_01325 [Polyangiaceae bacterium]